MKNFQNFEITPNGSGSVANMPRFIISTVVRDSAGNILADYTGANAINFPADLPTILNTATERRAFVEMVSTFLIERKLQG